MSSLSNTPALFYIQKNIGDMVHPPTLNTTEEVQPGPPEQHRPRVEDQRFQNVFDLKSEVITVQNQKSFKLFWGK